MDSFGARACLSSIVPIAFPLALLLSSTFFPQTMLFFLLRSAFQLQCVFRHLREGSYPKGKDGAWSQPTAPMIGRREQCVFVFKARHQIKGQKRKLLLFVEFGRVILPRSCVVSVRN